eukprot:3173412-Alexandrium_andersonii.AAC.1
MCIRDRCALLKWPGEQSPADVLTKAVNVDLANRHMQFLNLRWEDGCAACAPLLDGLSWDELDRKCAPESAKPERSDGKQARSRKNTRVQWADMLDAHEEAQSPTLS